MNERHIPVPAGWESLAVHTLPSMGKEQSQQDFKCNTFLRWLSKAWGARVQREMSPSVSQKLFLAFI